MDRLPLKGVPKLEMSRSWTDSSQAPVWGLGAGE